MKEISIVTRDVFGDDYILSKLAAVWGESGFRVIVGESHSANADVIILHHDLTILDPAALPSPNPEVPVLNGRVLDISKRVFSTLLLKQDDQWPGQVIIKTNLNHFGLQERKASPRKIKTKLRKLLARISWRLAGRLPERSYPVLKSMDDVPGWVWENSDLIVEKFMPERSEELYCLRGWVFFGSKSCGYRLFSTGPLVRFGTAIRYEYLDEIPEELISIRNDMGFDFGKFDYVVHEGKAILIDANKTPTWSESVERPNILFLAEGIKDFMR